MFTPVSARAASAYKRVSIETSVDGASPHQLVGLLFDALLRSLTAAHAAMTRGDIPNKGVEIGRAVRILEEGLKASLNDAEGGEVAANLRGIYNYSIRSLTIGNLDEVLGLIKPIAEAWGQMPESNNSTRQVTGV